MAVKIGELLGTHFIENGAIKEEQLARVLSQKLKVPFVRAERFEKIPSEIIGMISGNLVEKHGTIPLNPPLAKGGLRGIVPFSKGGSENLRCQRRRFR